MLKRLQQKDVKVRILMWVVVLMVGGMMVITLVPGPVGSVGENPNVVAKVDGQEIQLADVRRLMARFERQQSIPRALQALYAQQILHELIFNRLFELEAKRLGIHVSEEEQAERIKQLLPGVVAGDTFVGPERYAGEVQQRFQMTVPEFEDLAVRKPLLEEKFRQLVTDGLRVSPEEVEHEFRQRNEKVKIEYVLIKPEQLESQVPLGEAELAQYFEKNKARYRVPERRSVRYALLDRNQLRQRVSVSEAELRTYYNEHLDRYRIQNRARVSHILFKTIGKSDAEVEEIRKKAEDVLKKGKRGAKFEDLAKQFSEDTTKDAGGDLGWIVQGQTVPEFEHAAFTLPKGAISDVVKTQYGFHIINVVDRETARTQSFEEVRGSILGIVTNEKAERKVGELADRLAAAVRQSSRRALEEFAKEFGLMVGESGPIGVGDPVGDLGKAAELHETLLRLRPGELSLPVRIDRGYVVLTVKEILPEHQATLAEVREKVVGNYRREKAAELARRRAEELAQRAQSGEGLGQAAKGLGFELKTSAPFARTGSIPDLGGARQLAAAFGMAPGQISGAKALGTNWVVYGVVEREEAKAEELEKQRKEIEEQLHQTKRSLAYEAFRSALQERMKREGRLHINTENFKRLAQPL